MADRAVVGDKVTAVVDVVGAIAGTSRKPQANTHSQVNS